MSSDAIAGVVSVECPCGRGRATGTALEIALLAAGTQPPPFGRFVICRACLCELRLDDDGQPRFLPPLPR